jgi:hypothetical protein
MPEALAMVANMQEYADSETQDDILALALARGATRQEAGRIAGVSERTVYVRLSDSTFRLRVSEFRRAMIDGAIGKLATLADKAADVLGKLLDEESPAVRLRAAGSVLEQLTRIREHVELSERLEELERQVARNSGVGRRAGARR